MKYENLSNNLKKYRKILGLTQKDLANKILKSEISIRKYESGNTNIPPSVLIDLCNALGVSDKELLGNDFELYMSENIVKILKPSDNNDNIFNAFADSLIPSVPTYTLDFKEQLYNYIKFNYESNFDILSEDDKLTNSELHYLYKKSIEYIDLLTEKIKNKKEIAKINKSITQLEENE